MKIVVTGGTGFIGVPLVKKLIKANHQVIILTRDPVECREFPTGAVATEQWDGRTAGVWSKHLEGANAVINLAGEIIAGKRWSVERKALITNSRVDATKALVSAIANAKKKPEILVNASAVGYYGSVESGDVVESSPHGSDFLSQVCQRWEAEARVAEKDGVRVVMVRFGVVLGKEGGALKKMLLPFELFAGGPLGSGNQWFPWIHRDDVIGIILFAIEKHALSGAVNAAAPEPATMKQFCKTLSEVMQRPSWAPVPPFILKIALGEMADMVLTGQRVIPKKALDTGYHFLHPSLRGALQDILRRPH